MLEIIDSKSVTAEKKAKYRTDRFVRGPATVEVMDVDGEIVNVADLKDSLEEFEWRGGIVMVEHTHWHVGRLIEWEVKSMVDPKSKKEVPSLYVEVAIFKGKIRDDVGWKLIQDKKIKGFSISYSEHKKVRKCDHKSCEIHVSGADMMELTVTGDPANKISLFEEIEGKSMTDAEPNIDNKEKEDVKPPAEPDTSEEEEEEEDTETDDKSTSGASDNDNDSTSDTESKTKGDCGCGDKNGLEIDQNFIKETNLAVKSVTETLTEFKDSFKEIKELMVEMKSEKDTADAKIKELELEISKKSKELAKLKKVESPARPKIKIKSAADKRPRGQQVPKTWQEIQAESQGDRGIKIRT